MANFYTFPRGFRRYFVDLARNRIASSCRFAFFAQKLEYWATKFQSSLNTVPCQLGRLLLFTHSYRLHQQKSVGVGECHSQSRRKQQKANKRRHRRQLGFRKRLIRLLQIPSASEKSARRVFGRLSHQCAFRKAVGLSHKKRAE